MSPVSIAAEIEEVCGQPVSSQTIRRRRKPLLNTIHNTWSDEMKINSFGPDGFKHVWRRPGEEYKDKCVMPTVKHGGGNVMV